MNVTHDPRFANADESGTHDDHHLRSAAVIVVAPYGTRSGKHEMHVPLRRQLIRSQRLGEEAASVRNKRDGLYGRDVGVGHRTLNATQAGCLLAARG